MTLFAIISCDTPFSPLMPSFSLRCCHYCHYSRYLLIFRRYRRLLSPLIIAVDIFISFALIRHFDIFADVSRRHYATSHAIAAIIFAAAADRRDSRRHFLSIRHTERCFHAIGFSLFSMSFFFRPFYFRLLFITLAAMPLRHAVCADAMMIDADFR
jgi:hypothetical protein